MYPPGLKFTIIFLTSLVDSGWKSFCCRILQMIYHLQVLALSVVFFTLFAGNMTTILYVLRQKVAKTGIEIPQMPCN